MLRHLEGINPFPEVDQIYISCFHWVLHHCKILGGFASTGMNMANLEVQACSPLVVLTTAQNHILGHLMPVGTELVVLSGRKSGQ